MMFTAAIMVLAFSPETIAFVPLLTRATLRFDSRPLRLSTRTSDDFLTFDVAGRGFASSLLVNDDKSNDGTSLVPVYDDQDISMTITKHEFTLLQKAIRSLPILAAGAYAVNPAPLDGAVATIWDLVYNWDIAQNPLFEAEVASFGFFLWIVSFSVLHLFLGEEQTKANRFDGAMPHDPFEWTRFENWHLWFNPIAAYLGSIWLWLQIHDKPPMAIEAPTFGVLTMELLFGIWLYDLCFFPVHYLMHRVELGSMRKIHGYHHRSGKTTMNALETVQHSYIDGFLQVFVNIVVQQITPFGAAKHVLSRLLHNLSVTYLLTEAHSGYDLPWMSHNVFPEIFGGSQRHEKHHANGKVYYQQYFKYIDDAFGFTEEGRNLTPPRLKQQENNTEVSLAETEPAIALATEVKSQA
jgi:sterol desaturase/sphingolipid hydroxylase (fatty acid hydroxylase superfamily)